MTNAQRAQSVVPACHSTKACMYTQAENLTHTLPPRQASPRVLDLELGLVSCQMPTVRRLVSPSRSWLVPGWLLISSRLLVSGVLAAGTRQGDQMPAPGVQCLARTATAARERTLRRLAHDAKVITTVHRPRADSPALLLQPPWMSWPAPADVSSVGVCIRICPESAGRSWSICRWAQPALQGAWQGPGRGWRLGPMGPKLESGRQRQPASTSVNQRQRTVMRRPMKPGIQSAGHPRAVGRVPCVVLSCLVHGSVVRFNSSGGPLSSFFCCSLGLASTWLWLSSAPLALALRLATNTVVCIRCTTHYTLHTATLQHCHL